MTNGLGNGTENTQANDTANTNTDLNPNEQNNTDDEQNKQNGEQDGSDGEQDGQKNEQDKAEIYGTPEKYDYSEIEKQLPEGMQLDNELIKEFEPVAKKLNLSNKSANELMNLAVKLSQKNASEFSEYAKAMQTAKKDSYIELLNTDKELDANNAEKYNNYLNVAKQGLNAFATPEFIKVLREEGLEYHPEFIKTFHKIGKLCASDNIPNGNPANEELTPAQILYGKN